MSLEKFIKVALGESPADLLLKNCMIINTFSAEVLKGSIAICEDRIAGLGEYEALEVIDMKGMFAAPGFIDAHVHIESSMSGPAGFAKAVLPHGTTAVVADPHEIANVLGSKGINYMLDSSEGQPMSFYFALPSCVPATHMETSGAVLDAEDLRNFYRHPRVIALAEVMNYPGVINCSVDILDKISDAIALGKKVDGHAPLLAGKRLCSYVSAGIGSDHECSMADEAMEKIRMGMHIMIREGTCARNLQELLKAVNPGTSRRMMWCTDDRHPHDLMDDGHIDAIIRKAIKNGLDPVTAIQMATLNPAEYFGLRTHGAIAPGMRADIVFFKILSEPVPEIVYSGGKKVAEKGAILESVVFPEASKTPPSMNVKIENLDLRVKAEPGKIKVITSEVDQLITGIEMAEPLVREGLVVSDPERDILKIAVVERHSGQAGTGIGFIKGFGLKNGAMASSVCHDSHNLISVGTSDEDMKAAIAEIIRMGGGLAVACNGEISASLPLEMAGLMSFESVEDIRIGLDAVLVAAKTIGAVMKDPFMTMSFMALPVIPQLKITDKGLVDVNSFSIVSLFGPQCR